jgi:hypothetical protein
MNNMVRDHLTLTDLDRMAHVAVRMAWPRAMDYQDRYETAWSAIAEHLYASESTPSERDLKTVGCNAVNRLAQDHGRHWGLDRNKPASGFESAKGFLCFWELLRRATGSPEQGVVERLALRQIWPRLSDTHRAVLTAMAVHADNVAAAEALGKTYGTFNSHLRNARREFLSLWHEGETPSRMWGKGDRRHSQHRTAAQVFHERTMQRKRRAAKREASA